MPFQTPDWLKLQCVTDPGTAAFVKVKTRLNREWRNSKILPQDTDGQEQLLRHLYAKDKDYFEGLFPQLKDAKAWQNNANSMMRAAAKEWEDIAQDSLKLRGIPDEIIVWADEPFVGGKSVVYMKADSAMVDLFTPYRIKRSKVLSDMNSMTKNQSSFEPLLVDAKDLEKLADEAKGWVDEFIKSGGKVDPNPLDVPKTVIKNEPDVMMQPKPPTTPTSPSELSKRYTYKDIKSETDLVPEMVPGLNYASGYKRVKKFVTPDGRSFKTRKAARAHIDNLNQQAGFASQVPVGPTTPLKAGQTAALEEDVIRYLAKNVDDDVWKHLELNSHYGYNVSQAQRVAAKRKLNAELRKRLTARINADPALRGQLHKYQQHLLDSFYKHQVYDDKKLVEQFVKSVIDGWARTSGADSWAVFVQRAAAEQFDMQDALKILLDSQRVNTQMVRASGEYMRDMGELMKTLLDEMYKFTQQEFRAKGITHVAVHRGMWHADVVPRWVKDKAIQSGINKVDVTGIHRPLSSYSASPSTASSFGGDAAGSMMISMRVPVEYIIGTTRTGFGCLNEFELVVMGNLRGTATVIKGSRIRSVSSPGGYKYG